jgi:ABC-type nitrate/sulfonate/bicarbonate transport system substrate-binding protein
MHVNTTTVMRLFLSLIFAVSAVFPTAALAQKIKVGYWTSGFSLGFGAVMEQMKFAEKEGLDIEWVKFAEVNGPTRAIPSQAIDLAFGAPSATSMAIAADGVPVRIVLATQIAESQWVVLDSSPIKTMADLKGKKIGMTAPPSAMHAIVSAIMDNNFGLKASDYTVAPGNEGRLAQFLTQKDVDAASIRSVTIAQMGEVKLRNLGSTVDEWKKMTRSNAPPILAVTIVHSDYVTKNPDAVARFIAATRKAVEWGSKNKPQVAEILKKAANMNAVDALAYANQWDSAYFASFEAQDIATLKRMNQIFMASGTAKKDVPDSAFLTDPYVRSKQIK